MFSEVNLKEVSEMIQQSIYDLSLNPKSEIKIFFQVQDIEGALRVIKEKVASAKRFQDQIRNHEFRDRSIAEHNFERVNFWSILQLIIMIIAGFAQVMLVRSLFDEKSYLYKLWKRIF